MATAATHYEKVGLAYFSNKYGTIFDDKMIANVFATDSAEARDLFNPQLVLYVAVLGVLPSILIYRMPLVLCHKHLNLRMPRI